LNHSTADPLGLARFRGLFRHEHWNVGFLSRPIQSLLDEPSVRDAVWLPFQSTGAYIADPFGCTIDGRPHLFCEMYDYRAQRGYIVSGTLDTAAPVARLAPVLKRPFHLSYPFLLDGPAGLRMVPEAAESGRVTAYALDTDGAWSEERAFLDDVPAIDPTFVEHEGRWWMFCSKPDAPNSQLHAFYADRTDGRWSAHARNPVKSDIRSSRSAGTLFTRGGYLFRPAQDCSTGYGSRIALNRINVLSPDEFSEETVAMIEPDRRGPCPDGIHTMSAFGSITLIDGKYHRFVWTELRAKLGRALRKGFRAA
jgi:hypothetical protein